MIVPRNTYPFTPPLIQYLVRNNEPVALMCSPYKRERPDMRGMNHKVHFVVEHDFVPVGDTVRYTLMCNERRLTSTRKELLFTHRVLTKLNCKSCATALMSNVFRFKKEHGVSNTISLIDLACVMHADGDERWQVALLAHECFDGGGPELTEMWR